VGSGKSTVAALVLDRVFDEYSDDEQKQIAFFFCDRTSRADEIVSPELIFRSILKQMLRLHQRKIPDAIKKEYERKKSDGSISKGVCMESIFQLLDNSESMMIVLDGLDECDLEVREQFMEELIVPLLQRKTKVKAFVASRHEEDIDQLFDENSSLKCSKWTIKMDNDEDIQQYIQREVQRFDPVWRDKIKEELIQRSGGM
jgi:hypothetical protein